MNRLATAATTAAALLTLAACGSGSAATNASSSSSGAGGQGGGNGAGRNGAAGELVQVNGNTLILNSTNGDITVTFDPASTPVAKTSTGTVADIVPGVCITAAGTKDASGAVTASTVGVRNKVNGSCTLGGPGGAGGFGGGNRTPGADASPRPTPRNTPNPNAAFARGEVTAVSGTSVTLTDNAGAKQTITVPTTVVVSKTITGSAADLTIGSCVAAIGSKDASGTVAARQLSIQPAGPSGCFTGGRGGRGFGGGGFGGGGFGGGGFGGGGFGGGGVPGD